MRTAAGADVKSGASFGRAGHRAAAAADRGAIGRQSPITWSRPGGLRPLGQHLQGQHPRGVGQVRSRGGRGQDGGVLGPAEPEIGVEDPPQQRQGPLEESRTAARAGMPR